MEAGIVALIAIAMLAIGCIIGIFIVGRKTPEPETHGTIYVYYKETANGPSLLLDYNVPIDDIASRKQVLFDVSVIR